MLNNNRCWAFIFVLIFCSGIALTEAGQQRREARKNKLAQKVREAKASKPIVQINPEIIPGITGVSGNQLIVLDDEMAHVLSQYLDATQKFTQRHWNPFAMVSISSPHYKAFKDSFAELSEIIKLEKILFYQRLSRNTSPIPAPQPANNNNNLSLYEPNAFNGRLIAYCVLDAVYPIDCQLMPTERFKNRPIDNSNGSAEMGIRAPGSLIGRETIATRWYTNSDDIGALDLSENAIIYLLPLEKLSNAFWVIDQKTQIPALYTIGAQILDKNTQVCVPNSLLKSFIWNLYGSKNKIAITPNKNAPSIFNYDCSTLPTAKEKSDQLQALVDSIYIAGNCMKLDWQLPTDGEQEIQAAFFAFNATTMADRVKFFNSLSPEVLLPFKTFMEAHAPRHHFWKEDDVLTIQTAIAAFESWMKDERDKLKSPTLESENKHSNNEINSAKERIAQILTAFKVSDENSDKKKSIETPLNNILLFANLVLMQAKEILQYVNDIRNDQIAIDLSSTKNIAAHSAKQIAERIKQEGIEKHIETEDYTIRISGLNIGQLIYEYAKSIVSIKYNESQVPPQIVAQQAPPPPGSFEKIIQQSKRSEAQRIALVDPFGNVVDDKQLEHVLKQTQHLQTLCIENRSRLLKRLEAITEGREANQLSEGTSIEERMQYVLNHLYGTRIEDYVPIWPKGSLFPWLISALTSVGPSDYKYDHLEDFSDNFPLKTSLWPLATSLTQSTNWNCITFHGELESNDSLPACVYLNRLNQVPSYWAQIDPDFPIAVASLGPTPMTQHSVILIPNDYLSVFALCNPGFFEDTSAKPSLFTYNPNAPLDQPATTDTPGGFNWTYEAILAYLGAVQIRNITQLSSAECKQINKVHANNNNAPKLLVVKATPPGSPHPKEYFALPYEEVFSRMPLNALSTDKASSKAIEAMRQCLNEINQQTLSIGHMAFPYARQNSNLQKIMRVYFDTLEAFLHQSPGALSYLLESNKLSLKKNIQKINQLKHELENNFKPHADCLNQIFGFQVSLLRQYLAIQEDRLNIPKPQKLLNRRETPALPFRASYETDLFNSLAWEKFFNPSTIKGLPLPLEFNSWAQTQYDTFCINARDMLLKELERILLESRPELIPSLLDETNPSADKIKLEAPEGAFSKDSITEDIQITFTQKDPEGAPYNDKNTYEGLVIHVPQGLYELQYEPLTPTHDDNNIIIRENTDCTLASIPINISQNQHHTIQSTPVFVAQPSAENDLNAPIAKTIISVLEKTDNESAVDELDSVKIYCNAPGRWTINCLLPDSLFYKKPWWTLEALKPYFNAENLIDYTLGIRQWAQQIGAFHFLSQPKSILDENEVLLEQNPPTGDFLQFQEQNLGNTLFYRRSMQGFRSLPYNDRQARLQELDSLFQINLERTIPGIQPLAQWGGGSPF